MANRCQRIVTVYIQPTTLRDPRFFRLCYGNVWNIDNTVNGVSWLRSGSAEVITYTGVTTVEDDMVVLNEGATAAPTQAEMTNVYQWGYADVRVNGSQYGTIVNNPYNDLKR